MRRGATISVIAAVILALSACTRDTSGTGDGLEAGPGEETDEQTADAAPDFSFETFEGVNFTLAEQRGTPVVLNFWESW